MSANLERDKRTRERAIRKGLLGWFDAHARDLPWRRTRDPYAVFLSEIMLQQTRVDTVIPYFERFVARYPTVVDLAKAPIDDVLGLWSGLGYYRRARSLHLAAREVTEHHRGLFPSDRPSLEALPGIGPYTAGAIASIAFEKEEAIVDGNVARVLSRLFAIDAQLGSKESVKALWELARALVEGERPGDLNQALMELGALVCVPSNPGCGGCPVRHHCVARERDLVSELPVAKTKIPPKRVELRALLATNEDGEIFLAKRSMEGLFGGLWEPPMVSRDTRDEVTPQWMHDAFGGAESVGEVTHILTHRALSVAVARARGLRGETFAVPSGYVEVRWMRPVPGLGLSRLARKVLALAEHAPIERTLKPRNRTGASSKKRVVSPRNRVR